MPATIWPQELVSCQTIFILFAIDGPAVIFVERYCAAPPGTSVISVRALTGTCGKAARSVDAQVTYRLEDQIGFKLRLANQKHLEVFTRMMPDITPTQFAVLARLAEVGTLSQNHLGRLVGMDAATTKGVVDRLRKKGLATSAPSTTDMRRLEISLTDAGRAYAARAMQTAAEISAATARNLTPRELERLLALLDKL